MDRPYHHGNLHRALVDAAVAEIEAVGTAALSLREIARRAGVSHAAPAHHFGDKAGLFTAIATEGFDLLAAATGPVAVAGDGLLQSGIAYVTFAIAHRGHFDVMFRPELCRAEDPQLTTARERAFAVLFDAARSGAGVGEDEDVLPLVLAAWSAVHGAATLWLTGNLQPYTGGDIAAAVGPLAEGFTALGAVIGRQLPGD